MIKLLMMRNLIFKAFIEDQMRCHGDFNFTIASKRKSNKWNSYNTYRRFDKSTIREFLLMLRSQDIKYRIERIPCIYDNTVAFYVRVRKIDNEIKKEGEKDTGVQLTPSERIDDKYKMAKDAFKKKEADVERSNPFDRRCRCVKTPISQNEGK